MSAGNRGDEIQANREEVLSLLRQQKDLLERFESVPDLLREVREDNLHRAMMDLGVTRVWKEVLDNESAKVDRLEMVLVVVGTMKAGKSTTINAMVGTEILPNRNQPMTTLPTLIRHQAGQVVPSLTFPKPAPVIGMARQVRTALQGLQAARRLGDVQLYSEPDGRALVESILAGDPAQLVASHCHGQSNIFSFLKQINDLWRLARDPRINVELPLDDYEDVDELPVITVEFSHLRQSEAIRHGRFALLDTPGPNESGQSDKLRRIMRAQLARASSVLAVLDYTQLKSEAEAEIRNDLAEIAEQTENRLFVLVNKFDQQDRNGMDADQTREHVARALMGGRVEERCIFPVASRNAYLANRARQEVERHGRLPDPRLPGQEWATDFARLALGMAWKQAFSAPATALAASEELWSGSGFDAPIRTVMVRASAQAAMLSMQSALAKMVDYDRRMDGYLVLRRGSLTQDAEEVKALISGLQQDISRADDVQDRARKAVARITTLYVALVERLLHDARASLRPAVTAYFRTGRVDRRLWWEGVRQSWTLSQSQFRDSWRDEFLPFADVFEASEDVETETTLNHPGGESFSPESPIVKFDNEPSARRFASKVLAQIQGLIQDSVRLTERRFALAASCLEATVAACLREQVGPVLSRAEERLHDRGFQIAIKFPDPQISGIGLELAEVESLGVTQQVAVRKGRRETQGLLGRVGRWWKGEDSVWGYELSTHQETFHQVNLTRISELVLRSLDNEAGIGDRARAHVGEVVEPRIDHYYNDLRAYLEGFRRTLLDGMEDGKRRRQSVDELKREAGVLSEATVEHLRAVQARKQVVEALPPPQLPSLVEEDFPDRGGSGFDASPPHYPPPTPPRPAQPSRSSHASGLGPTPGPSPGQYAPPPHHAPARPHTLPAPHVPTYHEATIAASAPSWNPDATISGDETYIGEATLVGSLAGNLRITCELTYAGRTVTVFGDGSHITIGRGSDCTLVVTGRRASRQHCDIYYQNGAFVIMDRSTNGTAIQNDGEEVTLLSRSAGTLRGNGGIGMGMDPGRDPEHTIQFKCRIA